MSIKKYQSIILFLLGFGIFLFTRMSKLVPTIPIAILISFVLILRFIRTQPAGRGILLTLLGLFISMNIGLFGLFEVGGGDFNSLLFNLIRSSLLALLYFFPFMADRLIYTQFKNKGVVNAGPSTTVLYIDGAPKAHDSVGSLAAGSSSVQSFVYTYICAIFTSHNMTVRADMDNVVAETDEGNNGRSESFTCPWACGDVIVPYTDYTCNTLCRILN